MSEPKEDYIKRNEYLEFVLPEQKKRILDLEQELATLKAENRLLQQTNLWDKEYHAECEKTSKRIYDELEASIDDAPTWTIKNGKLDNWNSLTSLDFHNKTVTVALVIKKEE